MGRSSISKAEDNASAEFGRMDAWSHFSGLQPQTKYLPITSSVGGTNQPKCHVAWTWSETRKSGGGREAGLALQRRLHLEAACLFAFKVDGVASGRGPQQNS